MSRLQAGEPFGPFRIMERAGHGGVATVYKAYQESLARYVALKILPDHLATDGWTWKGPVVRTRF